MQGGAASGFHLVGSILVMIEKGVDVGADPCLRAEACVGGDLFADPVPDRLVGIVIGAIRGQTDPTQTQVGVVR